MRSLTSKKISNLIVELLTIVVFLIFMIPFLIVVMNSAKASLEITSNPVSFPENWSQIFTNIAIIWNNDSLKYPQSLMSSLIITIGSLITILTFSAMAAWVLVRAKTKTSVFIFILFLSGMVIPFQVVMFPLIALFRMIKAATGLSMLRTYHGMIIAYIGFGVSLSVFMFHGFIKSIPLELEEAATIDGCSRPRIFFSIITPILKPIIITVMILNGLWIWNDYLLPLLILGKGNIQTIPLAVAYFVGSFVKKWDLILTATLLAAIPIIVVFISVQKYIIKGMVAGSIK